jgi:hypothetical protein
MASKCDVRCDVDVVVYMEALSSALAPVSSRWVYLEVDHPPTFVFCREVFSASRNRLALDHSPTIDEHWGVGSCLYY